jgi:hypothetical protein
MNARLSDNPANVNRAVRGVRSTAWRSRIHGDGTDFKKILLVFSLFFPAKTCHSTGATRRRDRGRDGLVPCQFVKKE